MTRRIRGSGLKAPSPIRVAGSDQFCVDDLYGRRVETDRSWTVYRVFTGVPANRDGKAMIGLSRAAATQSMLAMNVPNCTGRMHRIHLQAPRLDVDEFGAWR